MNKSYPLDGLKCVALVLLNECQQILIDIQEKYGL